MKNPTNSKVTTKTELLTSCPICKSSDIKIWRKGYDRLYQLSDQVFTYSKCNGCSLIFLSERPLEEEIYKFYPEDYGPYHGVNFVENKNALSAEKKPKNIFKKPLRKILSKLNPVIRKILPDTFPAKFENYYKPAKPKQLFLDFGCGSDAFLNKAKSAGWDTIGMDFTPQPIESIKKSGHKGILFKNSDSWNEIEDNSLDFVRMNHVLEHLYKPEEIISKLYSKLKKGGILHIAIPNPHGISSKLYKTQWLGLDCPRHIMLFTPVVLEKLLSRTGFSKIEISHEVLTKDLARSIGFNQYDKKLIEHYEIHKKADDPELATILYSPVRIASALGASDRFHTFAIK